MYIKCEATVFLNTMLVAVYLFIHVKVRKGLKQLYINFIFNLLSILQGEDVPWNRVHLAEGNLN